MANPRSMSRRAALFGLAGAGGGVAWASDLKTANRLFRPWELTTFRADVTPPQGHPCMGGGIEPVRTVDDPLEAIGMVLRGGTLARPVVLVAVDWCEIRNDAYDRWREILAEAAGTLPQRVIVVALHQHDAPIVDLRAERFLRENGCAGSICNPEFHELAVQRVARSLRLAMGLRPRKVTHLGVGQARVEKVAANRRYVLPEGTVSYGRGSASSDPRAREAAEGTIDPSLRTLSFWEGDTPLLALSRYAVHPMSRYGEGAVSADFVGMARRACQKALPDVVQLYASGCSGNVAAGKYNDGSPANRKALASRLERAMAEAWSTTARFPLEKADFRLVPLRFEPRAGPGFTADDLTRRLTDDPKPFSQCLAAMGLSWRERVSSGQPVDLPVLDFGRAALVTLPGESYVEYQLLAQGLRPDAFVMALGYGESATGYIPTAQQIAEGDSNLREWSWVSPGAERVLTEGLRRALRP